MRNKEKETERKKKGRVRVKEKERERDGHVHGMDNPTSLYNKRACPTKHEPQQGISYLERERKGVKERGVGRGEREREREGWAGEQVSR
jgi:hypothetical protein